MKKFVKIKPREIKGNIMDAYHSWGEQMLLNKIGNYHLMLNDGAFEEGFEVVKETDKAFQIIVRAQDMFSEAGNDYTGHDWNVWMPKSAFIQ